MFHHGNQRYFSITNFQTNRNNQLAFTSTRQFPNKLREFSHTRNQNSMTFSQGFSKATNPQNFNLQSYQILINWREVMKLDLNFLQQTKDLSPFSNLIDNIIYCNLNEEDIKSVPEGTLVKLIKIYQTIIDNLLTQNKELTIRGNQLEEMNNKMENNYKKKVETIEVNNDLINQLKKDKQYKEMLITTSMKAIDNITKDSRIITNNSEIEQKFNCIYCPGRKFQMFDELYEHMKQRHSDKINIDNENEGENMDKKFDELKIYLNDYLNNNLNNKFMQYMEEQKKIQDSNNEKQINEMQKIFLENLKEIQNNFKEAILKQQFNAQKENSEIKDCLDHLNKLYEELKKEKENKMREEQNYETKVSETQNKFGQTRKEIQISIKKANKPQLIQTQIIQQEDSETKVHLNHSDTLYDGMKKDKKESDNKKKDLQNDFNTNDIEKVGKEMKEPRETLIFEEEIKNSKIDIPKKNDSFIKDENVNEQNIILNKDSMEQSVWKNLESNENNKFNSSMMDDME